MTAGVHLQTFEMKLFRKIWGERFKTRDLFNTSLQEAKGFLQVEFDTYPVEFLNGESGHLHSKYTKINKAHL